MAAAAPPPLLLTISPPPPPHRQPPTLPDTNPADNTTRRDHEVFKPQIVITPDPVIPPPQPLPGYLQENELPQGVKDIIASLPTEKGWVASYLHQYQGFWHTTRQLKGVLACQRKFQAYPSDVLLVTTPKSGTTWLKALTFALVERAHFPDMKKLHPLLTRNPHELVPFMEHQYIDDNNVSSSPDFFSELTSPRVLSTHLPIGSLPKSLVESGCKVVYLCRNPKDTFVSLWHFTNRLRPSERGENSLEEAFHKFCRGVSLYGPFWDHVLGYWKESLENPKRVLFLKYEEMRREPEKHLKTLSEFLGCPFSLEEEADGLEEEIVKLCSFENLTSLEVNKTGKMSSGEANEAFFRRGEVGDSANHLNDEMLEIIDRITDQKLGGSKLIL